MTCQTCGTCCHQSIEVTPSEWAEMARANPEAAVRAKTVELYDGHLLVEPEDACVFLNGNLCGIWGHRPSVCRSFLCWVNHPEDRFSRDRFDDPEWVAKRQPYLEDALLHAKTHGWRI